MKLAREGKRREEDLHGNHKVKSETRECSFTYPKCLGYSILQVNLNRMGVSTVKPLLGYIRNNLYGLAI